MREAGWTYLVATHLGTAFLLVMFVLLGHTRGSLDFDRLVAAQPGGLFLLALIGFGAKAGIVPFHVWLPEAHPAAPSHVSALMSGVMIKTGIYGILRVLTFLGAPAPWWGWLLIAIGALSAVGGVLFALAQSDLKRLLAYSSVENVGIAVLGIGLGVLGMAGGHAPLAVLGMAGALLHVLNHACFKGLLFLAAGAVAHAAGTRSIERLGGLLERMPVTGAAFAVGAVAVCGLPPLNGFVGEWLIYVDGFRGVVHGGAGAGLPSLVVIGTLALSGGLAAACFAKAFGIVFLGEPRSLLARSTREPGTLMRSALLVLAAACVGLGLGAPLLPSLVTPALAPILASSAVDLVQTVQPATAPLAAIAGVSAALLSLLGSLALLRWLLLRGRSAGQTVTWDCGYAQPSARMQYSGASFVAPLSELFALVLRTRHRLDPPRGLFPGRASLTTDTADVCRSLIYEPMFGALGRTLASLRWLQHGRVHLYILYIAVTLLVLLAWKLG